MMTVGGTDNCLVLTECTCHRVEMLSAMLVMMMLMQSRLQ